MGITLKSFLIVTDVAFILYWAFAAAECAGLVRVPSEWLYANAHDPRVVAWNWSFFPLDIAFAATGLLAAHAAARGENWRPLTLISLILTMAAGLMAVSYWTLTGEIDWSWYLANLVLVVWPIPFLARLLREMRTA